MLMDCQWLVQIFSVDVLCWLSSLRLGFIVSQTSRKFWPPNSWYVWSLLCARWVEDIPRHCSLLVVVMLVHQVFSSIFSIITFPCSRLMFLSLLQTNLITPLLNIIHYSLSIIIHSSFLIFSFAIICMTWWSPQ